MKNKKNAYTLMEILLVIGIIGVIAALIMPRLVLNASSSKSMGVLGKSVNQIEIACQNMIQDDYDNGVQEVETLSALGNPKFDASNFAKYALAKPTSKSSPAIKKYDGSSYSFGGSCYDFNKIPASYCINIVSGESEYKADIYIDTNTLAQGKNKLGVEVFYFRLRDEGTMEPYGKATDCPTADGGKSCAARVVRDGYKITY